MPQASSSTNYEQLPYYVQDVDFDDLARRDADWAAISKTAKQTKWIDFQDPQIVLQLTKSLLKADFNIDLDLPTDRICPPVPVRWNYVRWIQDLLDSTAPDNNYSDAYDPERSVLGLDIGVGASAIYPLLACSTRPQWRMVGTDIDEHSMDYARKNIEANGLGKRIKTYISTAEGPILPLNAILGPESDWDFVMTNPPFYDSQEDMQTSYGNKKVPPSAICTGSENEMICPGGDVGFVTRILDESLVLKTRVQWYTAMFGKLSSLQQIVAKLKQHNITNFAVTCLQAGYKTKRWALGWSFHDYRPRNEVARHGELVHSILPLLTEQTIQCPLMSAKWAGEKVDLTIKALDVRWLWRAKEGVGMVVAKENVWSRAARRKRQFQATREVEHGAGQDVEMVGGHQEVSEKEDNSDDEDEEEDESMALAVKIRCRYEAVDVRWLRGTENVVFTSFCGMLKRSLTNRE